MIALSFPGVVKDYPSMLNRIFLVTLSSVALATYVIRVAIGTSSDFLSQIDGVVPIQHLGMGITTLVMAVLVAGAFRAIKMHDRISDLLRIRERFDTHHILVPLALLSGANLRTQSVREIRRNRRNLMNQVFYTYATSTEGKEKIDRHLIQMALDQWAWFWVLVETLLVWSVSAIILLATQEYMVAAYVFLALGVLLFAAMIIYRMCEERALREVEAITASDSNRQAIAEAFREI